MTMIKSIGLYLHIPFCRGKCPYCDFYSVYPDEETVEAYVSGLIRKIDREDRIYDTVYFGGGTPSLLGAERISRIMSRIRRTENCEATLECNPSDTGAVDSSFDFRAAAESGINRISMGLQSAVDSERKALGRRAGCDDVSRAIERIFIAGINNVSLDLMLGIPFQTPESLEKSIDFCASSGASHVSAYILKIEEGTRFYEKRNELILPDEDETCELYLQTVSSLESKGFHQYEISNFAKEGFESRHNLKYWRCEEYLGIGAAAHSFVDGKRFFYGRNAEDFINGVLPVEDGAGGDEEEFVMLALRLSEGLSEKKFADRYGKLLPEKFKNKADFLIEKGLMNYSCGAYSLTERGFLLSNPVICELIECL